MFSRKITAWLVLTALLLFVNYIYFASSLSAMGYELEDREAKLEELIGKKNELVVKLANHKTPQYLLVQSQESGLVEIEALNRFIDARSSALGRASE